MKNSDIQALLRRGNATVTSLHPDVKDEITKSQIETAVRETKRALLSKKRVHLILVKE